MIFAFVPVAFNAQTEAEMKAQADKLFDTEKYLEATPLYLRLIALQPRDAAYNYKYGTCLLYNSNNKQEAIRYLSYATNDPTIAPEAYYFLGKALHLNYQFNEAIKHYTTYMQKSPKGVRFAEAERAIQMCQNGKRLMTTISDIIVTDKKEITIDKFFRIYDLKDIGGNLLVTAEFQTKLDKKNNHTPLIHFPQNPSVIYYSSYGENGTNGKDIYVRRKLPDGTWGIPQSIPGNVNTQFDEDFPYMHPDGNYLYFSSKGHNSMGGYDVFRSKYDPETNSYGPPENMDFAISSPDDDMFYVVDSLNKEAYFASARQSQDGKLFVYKVKVDRVPIQLAVVKGNFVSEVDPKIKKINFEIKDYSNGESVGKFNSNDKAVYLITFPKGGKYEYVMNIDGSSQEFRSIVSIPFMKEFKPLKQKIIHTTEDGKEIVKILNLFDEEVEDPQAVIAEVIKMRSELNVNVKEFNLDELEQDQKNKELLSEIGLGDLNTNELADILQKQVQKGNENKNLILNIENNIQNLIVENTAEFVQLEEQIKSKVAEANAATQADAKYVALKEAERMINKQQELKQYSKSLVRLNDSIKGVLSLSASGSDQQRIQVLSNQFNQLYQSGNEKEAIQLVADNKDLLKDIINDKSTDLVQNLVDRVVKLDDDMSKLNAKVDGYSKDISNNEIEINSLQNSIYTAKKKDVPAIEQKIAEKQNEIVIIKEERDDLQRSIDKKSLEKYQVNKQIEILQDAISNKSVAAVSKEQANKAIAETEKTNSNTLTAYVTQQINELERKDPTLKDRIVVSSGLRAQNIYSDYKSSTKGIQDDPSLSKEDKLYKLLSNERTALKQLDKRLEEIEKLRENDKTNAQLNDEKAALLTFKQEIEEQIAKHENLVENLLSQNGSNDPEILVNALEPGYSDNKKAVESNPDLTEEEKWTALNTEDNQLVSSVDKELTSVQKQLAADPSNPKLKEKEANLKQIKTSTENAIASREKALEQKQLAITPKERIAQLNPSYEEKTNEILTSTTLSDDEKLMALNKEDETLLTSVDKELVSVKSQLTKDPNNKALQAKESTLNQIKAEKEAAMDQRKAELNAGSTVVGTISAKEMIAQLSPSYEEKTNEILSSSTLSDDEKLTALNKEDETLVISVDKEIASVKTQLVNDPNNKALLAKESALNQIKAEKAAAIEQRKAELNAGNTVATSEIDQLINSLEPTYMEDTEKIALNTALTKNEKEAAYQKLDKELLTTIDERQTAIEKSLKKDPSNEKLIQEKEALSELKSVVDSRVEERAQLIASQTTIDLSDEVLTEKKVNLRAQLDPTYDKKIEEAQTSDKPEVEKLSAELKVEETLLTKLKAEETKLQKALAKDPSNAELKTQLTVVQQLRKDTENRISSLNESIFAVKNGTSIAAISEEEKAIIIANALPNYVSEKEQIASNADLSKEEKVNADLALENELLESIDEAISTKQTALKNDASNVQLKRDLAVLNQVKKETETRIGKLNNSEKEVETIDSASSEEKNKEIESLRPEYAKEINDIRANSNLTELEKLEALQTEDQQLVATVYDRIEQLQDALTEDPSNTNLQDEYRVLKVIEKELEAKIDTRQKEINAGDVVSISNSEKAKMLNAIDGSYNKDVQDLESKVSSEESKLKDLNARDIYLQTKLQKSLVQAEKELEKDPTNKEKQQSVATLKALISDAENRIEERNKRLSETSSIAQITEAEKEAVQAELMTDYATSINEIENNSSLSNEEKKEAILSIENELGERISTEKITLKEELANNPSTTQVKARLAVVEALEKDSEARIEAIKSSNVSKRTTVDEAAKEKVISEVYPDYESKKETLSVSKLEETKKIDASLKLENELLTKLTAEKKTIEKVLTKDPTSVELKEKLAAVKALIEDQQSTIESLENQKATRAVEAQKEATLAKVDPTYSTDIEKLTASTSETKQADLIAREEAHQAKIETQIAANDKALAKKENPVLEAQNTALKEELSASKVRVNGGMTSPSNIAVDPEEQASYQSNLREDVLQENAAVVNAEPSELNELKEQVVVLERYETVLKDRIAEKETVLKANPSDETYQKEVLYLKDELANVQKKLRKAKISIGELEKIAAFGTTEDQRYDDPELNRLNEKSASLQKELANENLSAKEKQLLQKELTQIETQKTVQENKLMSEEIAENKQQSTEFESQLKDDAKINETTQTNSRIALVQQNELNKEVATIINDANATKNPVEKNYLLNKALEKQEQANDIAQTTLVENKLQALEEQNGIESLATKTDLEKKQRRYSIQVGELTREIQTLDQQIATAKGKELTILQTEKNQKVEERSLVQKQLEEVNTALKKEDKLPETTNPLAMETAVSYNEEREIAATEGYKNYYEKANAALEVEKQITKLDAQILQVKSQTKQFASKSIDNPTDENKQALEQNVSKIKQLEAERGQLKEELTNKQAIANTALPMNTEEAMKMQNLVKRGIEPIQRMAIVAALVPMPANGLTIKEAGIDSYSTANPIPVDVKTPTGLIYRVQVGAFAKPIPQNLFNKFNPVSGEKLNNGITRYMAGYFNNSKKVVEAREQIKQLGYQDAFAVAYCDGKRITLAEARILEANGQCVAKGENELVLEVASNTAEKMGLGDSIKLMKVDELTYNQAPGAVKAEPIEKHLGLFFTVQVGAFNRPVTAGALNGIEPLNTLRLPNGQIRYTTGMFNTVDEARPKKQDAINRGVKDAFITAYYKGERISIADALKLLEEKGTDILELNQLTTTPVVATPKEVIGATPAVTSEEAIEEISVVEFSRYQIVTKKTFDEFPREVLNRYNSHGSFYYDETDKTVKSTVAKSKDELPDVYTFRNDVDTLITLDEGDEPGVTVIATFASTSLPGDFTDWLLRYNFRREMKLTEDTIELRISRVTEEKLTELENKLNEFAIPYREERMQE